MPAPKPVQRYIFTEHALAEMARRGISKDEDAKGLAMPEQAEHVRKGRVVYQSKLGVGYALKEYLLRVFVDIDRNPLEVVTAYRTS